MEREDSGGMEEVVNDAGEDEDSFTFSVPRLEWEERVRKSTAMSGQRKRSVTGREIRDPLFTAFLANNQHCLLNRGQFKQLRVRVAENSEEARGGDYASGYLRCRRPCKDGSKCDVVYKVTRRQAPADDEAEVEFHVRLLVGNPRDSHPPPDPDNPTPSDFVRSNLSTQQRNEIKEIMRQCNNSLKELNQKMTQKAVRQGAPESGNLSGVPTVTAMRHILRELREEDVLDPNPILDLMM